MLKRLDRSLAFPIVNSIPGSPKALEVRPDRPKTKVKRRSPKSGDHSAYSPKLLKIHSQ